jgi:hypothetical protein
MGGLNGVAHQIATFERRYPAPPPEPEPEPEGPLVPIVVIEYLEALELDRNRWNEHALIERVVAHAAVTEGPYAALLAAQGWTLRQALLRLGGWLGCEQAGWHQPDMSKRRSATADNVLAARQLFDMDVVDMPEWTGPHEPWIDRWRDVADQVDALTRSRAGLGERELELLAVKGED